MICKLPRGLKYAVLQKNPSSYSPCLLIAEKRVTLTSLVQLKM
jgi:hypothetical protein